MKTMARRIAKELANAKQCGVYEPELSRFWPNNGNARESEIDLFAELHGLRLRYYKDFARFPTRTRIAEEFGARSIRNEEIAWDHCGLAGDNIHEVTCEVLEFVIGRSRTKRPTEKNLNK